MLPSIDGSARPPVVSGPISGNYGGHDVGPSEAALWEAEDGYEFSDKIFQQFRVRDGNVRFQPNDDDESPLARSHILELELKRQQSPTAPLSFREVDPGARDRMLALLADQTEDLSIHRGSAKDRLPRDCSDRQSTSMPPPPGKRPTPPAGVRQYFQRSIPALPGHPSEGPFQSNTHQYSYAGWRLDYSTPEATAPAPMPDGAITSRSYAYGHLPLPYHHAASTLRQHSYGWISSDPSLCPDTRLARAAMDKELLAASVSLFTFTK
eukprot:gene6088-1088_t